MFSCMYPQYLNCLLSALCGFPIGVWRGYCLALPFAVQEWRAKSFVPSKGNQSFMITLTETQGTSQSSGSLISLTLISIQEQKDQSLNAREKVSRTKVAGTLMH